MRAIVLSSIAARPRKFGLLFRGKPGAYRVVRLGYQALDLLAGYISIEGNADPVAAIQVRPSLRGFPAHPQIPIRVHKAKVALSPGPSLNWTDLNTALCEPMLCLDVANAHCDVHTLQQRPPGPMRPA